LSLHPLQFTYIATTSSVNHPLLSRSVSSGGMLPSLQYSYVFFYVGHTGLLFYYTFCGLATCVTSFLLLCYNIWTLLFIVPYPLISKILYFFLFSFLPLYLNLFFYSISHYLTFQHFKLVFRDWFSLFSFNPTPAVIGQIPKLPILEIFSSFSFF